MPVVEVDGKGVRANSLSQNLRETQNRLAGEFGSDLSVSPQTPQGQIAGIYSLGLTEIGEAIVRLATAVDVDHAEDTYLDILGSLLDIRRREATKSRVTATLTGVAGTNVPVGSIAKTAENDQFETLASAVLSPSGITVDMEAVDDGPVVAAAGTLTQIVSVIAGWETVTNVNAATVGTNRETTDEYRRNLLVRTAHSSIGPLSALKAALNEAGAVREEVGENNTKAAIIKQEWTIQAHSLLVIAQSGVDTDLRRAVENHRSMGAGTMTAIVGGTADETALALISAGMVAWNGTDYTGLDLSGTADSAARAVALTALLAADSRPPTVAYIDGNYVAQFPWMPNESPAFGTGTTEAAFGLNPAAAAYPQGPFVRTNERALAISFTLTRRTGFPSNGLDQVRTAVLNRVKDYDIGEQIWDNDILCAAESVPGTRITVLSVQYNSASVSGVDVPLNTLWTLATADLTITVA